MKDLFKKFSFLASIVTLILSAFTFTACGGDDDDALNGSSSTKGNVYTFEVYLDGDMDKFGIDGTVLAYDKENGHGKFKTDGGVVLDSYESGGFLDETAMYIAGYCRVFGNGLGLQARDFPTTSRHFSITSDGGCEKMEIKVSVYSNRKTTAMNMTSLDETAAMSIRVIGYMNGKKIDDKEFALDYIHSGSINMIIENGDSHGYLYRMNDGTIQYDIDEKW